MAKNIENELNSKKFNLLEKYCSDKDNYIRKNAYLILSRIYLQQKLQQDILQLVNKMIFDKNKRVRQTEVYLCGEIGKIHTGKITPFLKHALKDKHHSVRNAVIGALKRMGEKNPKPTISFAKKFIHDTNPETRRQIIHGIELRGRTHPQDILPLLKKLENDPNKRVRQTIVHVLSQISYKTGCLSTVLDSLEKWKNKDLVEEALEEIIDVHRRYQKFSALSYIEARKHVTLFLNRNN